MASSQSSSQLVDRVSCVVCMEQYDRASHVPKLLPCQHTFCEVCIRGFTEKNAFPRALRCPTCRCKHVLPRKGFITNRAILDTIDELLNDTTRRTERALKCAEHANKDAVMVCIDCLDALCVACVKSSSHSHSQHHMEELDTAKSVLQKKFIDRDSVKQSLLKEKLSLLKESPCSCAEMTKADADIKSIAEKLHAQINKWENEERLKVEEIKYSAQEHDREMQEELNTIPQQDLNVDITNLLCFCKRQQIQRSDESDIHVFVLNKLQPRDIKGTELCQWDERLATLLDGMRLECKSKTSLQSKLLKKEEIPSVEHHYARLMRASNISEIPSFGRISDFSNTVELLLVNVIVMTLVFLVSFCFIISTIGLSPVEEGLNGICDYFRPNQTTTEGFFCPVTVYTEAEYYKKFHPDFEYPYSPDIEDPSSLQLNIIVYEKQSQTKVFFSVLLLYMAAMGISVTMQIICRKMITLSTGEVTFFSGLAYCCKFFFVMLGLCCSPIWYLKIAGTDDMRNYDLIYRLLFVFVIPACIIQWISPELMRSFIYRRQASSNSFRYWESDNPPSLLFSGICDNENQWKLVFIPMAASVAHIAIYSRLESENDRNTAVSWGIAVMGILFILQIVSYNLMTLNVMGKSPIAGIKYTLQFCFMMLGLLSTLTLFNDWRFLQTGSDHDHKFIIEMHILSSLMQLVPVAFSRGQGTGGGFHGGFYYIPE